MDPTDRSHPIVRMWVHVSVSARECEYECAWVSDGMRVSDKVESQGQSFLYTRLLWDGYDE